MDNLSLVISPSLMYMADCDYDPAGDDKYFNMVLDLGIEPTYYLQLSKQSVLSFALNFSIGFIPGLDDVSSGTDDPDDSFSMLYSLEPKAAYYFFTSENLAPFAELGYKFMYRRDIKESDGTDTVYPSNYSMLDEIRARLRFTLGLKYFLPSPARAAPAPLKGEFDIMIDGKFGK